MWGFHQIMVPVHSHVPIEHPLTYLFLLFFSNPHELYCMSFLCLYYSGPLFKARHHAAVCMLVLCIIATCCCFFYSFIIIARHFPYSDLPSFTLTPCLLYVGTFSDPPDSSNNGAKIWCSGYHKCQKSLKKSLFTFQWGASMPQRGAIAP